ncbi:Pre-mRNA splicing Prp18-interacting factor-domain-containing protein [Tribonema minus]|uniref:Pre-mRNA-splicing factor SLU7 n=1 Tax=Tribonema minus TaxID=303371 RepID=A0A836CLD5_9STRA|nr:Pre-mRNA splicing Prp18-interacting factor-domain-containing protein [Tribonema minus]
MSVTDFKKRKQIEQARMSGQLAPETDTETGKMINPHNPDFISKRPWYLGDSGPSLKHHSKQKSDHVLSMKEADMIVQTKWAKKADAAVKFRPGACKNCGAMGHKTTECVERPRSTKRAAWKTGVATATDDTVVSLEAYGKLNFDAKRDRWHGYHPDQHKEVVERFNKLDEERRRARQQEQEETRKAKADRKGARKAAKAALANGEAAGPGGSGNGDAAAAAPSGSDSASDSDSDSDSDAGSEESEGEDREFIEKDTEKRDFQGRVARQGGLGGAQMATTVRNLRIREDRAKYLYNLDPDSAYYDPKTRAMRENPNPSANPEELAYAGDNFMRYGGGVKDFARTQVYAWEAAARGQELHPVADPSQAELLHRQFEARKDALKGDQRTRILEKYGGGGGGAAGEGGIDPRLALGQSEAYVEYDRAGRVIKGAAQAVARSKYEEDVVPGNHASVWGSYYERRAGRWGFACCHALSRAAYCTGAAGRAANDEANDAVAAAAKQLAAAPAREMLAPGGGAAAGGGKAAAPTARSEVYGESSLNPVLDEEKLKAALRKEEEFQRRAAEGAGKGDDAGDDRKRKYNSFQTSDVTVEEMEAYRMRKRHGEDPMANISSDTLLEEE